MIRVDRRGFTNGMRRLKDSLLCVLEWRQLLSESQFRGTKRLLINVGSKTQKTSIYCKKLKKKLVWRRMGYKALLDREMVLPEDNKPKVITRSVSISTILTHLGGLGGGSSVSTVGFGRGITPGH